MKESAENIPNTRRKRSSAGEPIPALLGGHLGPYEHLRQQHIRRKRVAEEELSGEAKGEPKVEPEGEPEGEPETEGEPTGKVIDTSLQLHNVRNLKIYWSTRSCSVLTVKYDII